VGDDGKGSSAPDFPGNQFAGHDFNSSIACTGVHAACNYLLLARWRGPIRTVVPMKGAEVKQKAPL